MKTEVAIGLELLLCEQLIERRLMREIGIAAFVVDHIVVFVSGERRSDIEQHAGAVGIALVAVFARIVAGAERTMWAMRRMARGAAAGLDDLVGRLPGGVAHRRPGKT